MHNRGYHVFLSKFFCLTLPKSFVNETYCFWEIFSYRKIFRDEKGGYHIFPSRNLGLTEPKILVSNLAMFQKNCGIGNFYVQRGYHVFVSKFLGRKVPKKFLGIPSRFQNIRDIEKFHSYKGLSRFSVKNVLFDLAEKFCERILLFLREVHVSKSFYVWKWGVSYFSVGKLWSHRAEKIASIPAMFQKICGIGK